MARSGAHCNTGLPINQDWCDGRMGRSRSAPTALAGRLRGHRLAL